MHSTIEHNTEKYRNRFNVHADISMIENHKWNRRAGCIVNVSPSLDGVNSHVST